MKKLTLIFLPLLVTTICFAQFAIPIKMDANEISKRTLAVELLEINEKTEKKLSKKSIESKENYLSRIETYNNYIKQTLPKYWKLNKNIVFLNTSEIEKIMDEKDTKYVVFLSGFRKEANASLRVIYTWDSYTFFLYNPADSKGWSNRSYVDNIKTSDANGIDKYRYLTKISFPSATLNDNDFKLMSDLFQYNIERAKIIGKEKKIWRRVSFSPKIETRHELFKTDTLLITESSITFNKDTISTLYSFPVKIVSNIELEQTITQQKKGYIYFSCLWDDSFQYFTYYLIRTQNNEIIERIGMGNTILEFNEPFYRIPDQNLTYRDALEIPDDVINLLDQMIRKEKVQWNKDIVHQ